MAKPREAARERPEERRESPGIEIPDFIVTGMLGSGSRGTVYSVSDGKRALAAKVLRRGISLDEQALGRFAKGAPNRVRHPNLIAIEVLGRLPDGSHYYVMPLLRGDSLERLLQDLKRGASERPSLSPFSIGPGGETDPQLTRRAAELIAEAADGLERTHQESPKAIVHQRLSPRNLILTPAGRFVITDFGGDGASESITDLAYRAPEQLDPYPEPATPAADVHALGVILYEILVRRLPFAGEGPKELKEIIQKGRFPRPRSISPGIPEELEACVLKAMALDPADRYASAGGLAADLRRALRGEQPLAMAPAGLPPPRRGILPSFAVRAAAAVVLAAALGASWWLGKRIFTDQSGTEVTDSDALPAVVSLNPGRGPADSSSMEPSAERLRLPSDSSETSPPGPDLLADLLGGSHASTAAALARLEAEVSSGIRPLDDALLAARAFRSEGSAPERRVLETMALARRGDALLDLVRVDGDRRVSCLDSETFRVLHSALESIGDDSSIRFLCSLELDSCETADHVQGPAAVRIASGFEIALSEESTRDFTARWIRTMAKHDPGQLLDATPRLAGHEGHLEDLISGLEACGSDASKDALVRLAREHCLTAGQAALNALARLSAHTELLELARSELHVTFRTAALRRLGAGFAGLYVNELRALSLTSPEPEIRRLAFRLLSEFDEPDAVRAIPGALYDPELRDDAADWLGRLAPDMAAPILLDALSQGDPGLRSLAAERLVDARSTDLLLPLASRLIAPSEETREAALSVLFSRNEITRIPGAMAVVFGNPRISLREGAETILDDLLEGALKLSIKLRRAAGEAEAGILRRLAQIGISALARGLLRTSPGR